MMEPEISISSGWCGCGIDGESDEKWTEDGGDSEVEDGTKLTASSSW